MIHSYDIHRKLETTKGQLILAHFGLSMSLCAIKEVSYYGKDIPVVNLPHNFLRHDNFDYTE